MLRFRMLGLERGKCHSIDWAAAAAHAGRGNAAGQSCWGIACELMWPWKKCRGKKAWGKKSIKNSSPIFPTRVSTESAQHWHRGFTWNVCAVSQRQRCKEAARKQNIFTDVAFSLQLESVTRLLLFFVAEKWKLTFWLLHSWSSRQISEQRCSEQRAALGLVYEESTGDQYWAEKLPSELWFI